MFHENKFKHPPKSNGRPKCLNDDELMEVSCYINDNYYSGEESPTYDDIREFISKELRKDLLIHG